MKNLSRIEVFGYMFLIITFVNSLYFGFTDAALFNEHYAQEDGLVENETALMLLAISILCVYHLFKLWNFKKPLWKAGTLIFAVLFFFAAGEEISWGQRIFGMESGEFFLENNAQGETNLHNLVVGDTKVNKLIFSQLLMIVMVLYLVIVPLLYKKVRWIKNLADTFAVPIVEWRHTIAFIVCTILVSLIPADRKWEVYELAFGIIFFLIFLNPFNRHIFRESSNAHE
ncbi:hypothetical protein ED312_12090 [Sinomicrobium pectinilyticum]|uniref:Uncharacterized protein n=1 Tax=Sinomicrobium pectinilyticum TaxID=1084421 RepID=A0A3N0ECN1_SINP1|nr:hypothetical protein [Sinomicrobium pectinilyticum]RNL85602.1 hypothetical protein ED312_12090 [Sinomicrobium pectinilyticum]